MDGRIDWGALPAIVELYGIDDVETFIAKLYAIMEFRRLVQEVERGK